MLKIIDIVNCTNKAYMQLHQQKQFGDLHDDHENLPDTGS